MINVTWVTLAFVSAVLLTASDALTKRSLEGDDEYLVASFRLFFSLPLLIPVLFIIPVPKLDAGFSTAFCIALPVEAVTVVLYIKALKASPLSIAMPFPGPHSGIPDLLFVSASGKKGFNDWRRRYCTDCRWELFPEYKLGEGGSVGTGKGDHERKGLATVDN